MKRVLSAAFACFLMIAGSLEGLAQSEAINQKNFGPFEIQQALVEAGYYDSSIDGIVGPKTRAAIRAFQKDEGLKADGICGLETWQRLKTHWSGEPEPEHRPELSPLEALPPELAEEGRRTLTKNELKKRLVP